MKYPTYLLTTLLLLAVLAGCVLPAPVETADPAADGTAVTATTGCDEGFRLFDHESLATDPLCIPTEPQRIIALNENTMANLLALGVTPVGVVDYANRDYTRYLGDTTTEIASVGNSDGPNIESMLALNPDLILGISGDLEEGMLADLQQVVPVAVSESSSADWEDYFAFVGDAVQMGDLARDLATQTNSRLAEFRTAYGEARGDETIAIIRSRADSFNIYNKESFIAELSKEAGLIMPASFDELEAWNSLSLEAIPMLTSDKLFVMIRNEREAGALQGLSESPLWQTLPAVESDQVHLVNWSVWVAGWNVIGANLVIDDFYVYMLDQQPSTPNPFTDLIIDEFGPAFDEDRLNLE